MEIKIGQPRDHEIHNPTSVMTQEQQNTPNKEPAFSSVVDDVSNTSSTGMSAAKSGAPVCLPAAEVHLEKQMMEPEAAQMRQKEK